MTRVFIAAPTPALRAGLRALLADEGADRHAQVAIQVVGEGAGIEEYGRRGAADVLLVADQVLLAAGSLAAEDEAPALVLLSDDGRAAALLQRLPLRGWGIVSPEASAGELQAAVQAAAQGLVVLAVPLASRLLAARPTSALTDEAPIEPLTAREREVLTLLSQGLSNKLIARRLQISEHTVKFHVASIFTKLGAASRTEAVSRGARSGLITL